MGVKALFFLGVFLLIHNLHIDTYIDTYRTKAVKIRRLWAYISFDVFLHILVHVIHTF